MSDDRFEFNPAHIWKELVPVWMDTASSQPQAAPLTIGNQSERELLEGMLSEVQRLASNAAEAEAGATGHMARKCEALIELFLVKSDSPITDADPLNLAMLFYEYGRLTMPSSLRDLALSNTARHHVASVQKKSHGSGKGGRRGAETKQQEAAPRMAQGKRAWDSMEGKPKSERIKAVQERTGVSRTTVTRWIERDWK